MNTLCQNVFESFQGELCNIKNEVHLSTRHVPQVFFDSYCSGQQRRSSKNKRLKMPHTNVLYLSSPAV